MPGAVLRYDTREAETESTAPMLLLIGSPMDAGGSTTLTGALRRPDGRDLRDPRGVERSERTDGAKWSTPEEHPDDLNRLS